MRPFSLILLYLHCVALALLVAAELVGLARAQNGSNQQCLGKDNSSNSMHLLTFPEVLQRAGKTVFRPGGTSSTEKLRKWAGLPSKIAGEMEDCRILEMAAGIGGLDAASHHKGCHVLVIDKDAKKLRRINKLAKKKGLCKHIHTRCIDLTREDITKVIDYTKTKDENGFPFDAVIFEASLTQYNDNIKRKILQDLHKISPQVLLHEIGLRESCHNNRKKKKESALRVDETKVKVGKALGLPDFSPLSVKGWESLLQDCGYTVTHQETGPLLTLSPKTMLLDEGPSGVAHIAYNLASQRELRERITSTKATLTSHSDTLGYILLRGVRR